MFRSSLSLFVRTIWNSKSYREITALIREHHPDVIHCHNTFPLISPSVYWAAARQGVPVVQTLHNYRLVCINPYLYRNGRICEDCLGRSPLRGVIHRCYRNSFSASFTVAAMLVIHRLLGTYRNKVTTYIALTEFGRKKFLEARLCSPDKVVVKPNAVAAPCAAESSEWRVVSSSGRGSAPDPASEPASLGTAAEGPGFRVQDQRLAASGQGLGAEDAQGSGFRGQEEETLSRTLSRTLSDQEQPLAAGEATSPTKPTSSTPTAAPVEGKPCHISNQGARLATPDAQIPASCVQSQSVGQPHSAQPPEPPVSSFQFQVSTPATVLYVGRLSPEKGPHLLLEAWRLLALKNPEIVLRHRLVIAGGGPEQQALEEKAKALPSIDFTGHLSRPLLHAHMTAACVLVLPSTCYETFAMAVNEAAALGTPAIVSDIGGQASLVEDGVTGYLFRSGSAESLAETMAKALDDPDRLARISATARERFHAGNCPPERNVAALSATYGHSVAVRRCQQKPPPPACGH